MSSFGHADDKDSERKGERLLDDAANFKAAFDKNTMNEFEEAASAPNVGIVRKMMLASLTSDAATLSGLSLEAPDTYEELLSGVAAFAHHARAMHEAAESALLRLQIADKRQKKPGDDSSD